MFRRTNVILAAVSGGADSLALLLVLRELKQQFGFDVIASHFDHKLRDTSAADMERVRDICADLGVECFTGEGDVRDVAAAPAQLALRKRRGRCATSSSPSSPARSTRIVSRPATPPTTRRRPCSCAWCAAAASAESAACSPSPASPVRRPNGSFARSCPCDAPTRSAICAEAGIEPLADPSNADVSFARNRLRHETLPVLRALNPSVDAALLRLASSARELFADVERQSLGVQPVARLPVGSVFSLPAFAALPAEARTLVIEREAAFAKTSFEVNATRVENLDAAIAAGSGEAHFGESVVEVSCGRVRIGPPLGEAESFEPRVLNVPGITVAGPWRIAVSTDPPPPDAGALTAAIDASAIKGVLRARLVGRGDRIRYHGQARKVADVLSNAKVPRWERLGMVAAVDAEGVVALFGSNGVIADRATTTDALYITLRPA